MHCSRPLLGWFFLFALATALAGCANEPTVVEPPPLEVVVMQPVRKKDLKDWDNYIGYVQAKESVNVTARVRGEIKEVAFKEGEEIKAGTTLFLIDSEPFKADLEQAKGLLASWQAKQKLAEEKIALYQPLADKGTVSKEELLNALSDKAEAIGGIDTAKGKIKEAELNIGYCTINSPIDGRIGQALLTKGNMVNSSGSDSLLTTVVTVDPMYVYFNVNERALLNYQRILRESAAKTPEGAKDDKPEIPVQLALLSDVGFPFEGVIDFVDNQVDKKTGSVKVRGRFANPKEPAGGRRLTAGLFARIRVAIVEPYEAILVPDRAVLTDQSLKYVLVVNKEKKNTVERKDVIVSRNPQSTGLVVVESGLNGNEWIIVEGVNRARPGVIVNPKEPPEEKKKGGGK